MNESDNASQPNLPSGWGVPKNLLFDKELPSGAKVRIRLLEMEDLVNLGILDAMDNFSPEAIKTPGEVAASSSDQKKSYGLQLLEMFQIIDKVVVAALVKPKVLERPKNSKDRVEGKLYVDGIPQSDRTEIFNSAAEDMSSFLGLGSGQEPNVGVVETGAVVQNNSE